MAGAFLPACLLLTFQNFSFRKQPFLLAAPQAHSVKALRSQRLPLLVWLLLFLPALRLLPGQRPAQEPICPREGNWLISPPVSAKMLAALICWMAGTVCTNSHCGFKPA